jgi:hypothetical protein
LASAATRAHFLVEARALRETLAAALAELKRLRAIVEMGNLERTRERLN